MLRSSVYGGALRASGPGLPPPLRRLAVQGLRTTTHGTGAPAPLRPRIAAVQPATATTTRTFGTARGRAAATASPPPPPPPPRRQRPTGWVAQRRTFGWSWPRRSGSGSAAKEGGGRAAAEPQSLSARLRKLSREYGWAALGVYLGLSVLDFPFCFLLVRMVGTDRIAEVERWVMAAVRKAVPESVKSRWHEYRAAFKDAEREELGDNRVSEDVEKVGWGVEKAQERHKAEASLATQLALAYAIHKSFIFIRVPLTAALTPKVVKVLRGWGYQIGKRKPKAG